MNDQGQCWRYGWSEGHTGIRGHLIVLHSSGLHMPLQFTDVLVMTSTYFFDKRMHADWSLWSRQFQVRGRANSSARLGEADAIEQELTLGVKVTALSNTSIVRAGAERETRENTAKPSLPFRHRTSTQHRIQHLVLPWKSSILPQHPCSLSSD